MIFFFFAFLFSFSIFIVDETADYIQGPVV